ncbi:uncharacterized protein CELE_F56D6.20 [Caenorhabditis elegans]|uniref:Uncharacterized protein n=1 Tax=Caenorhabditis elegans TaxID=6239 RepID=U4PFE8_CAEEL|nr:Uncharacterized protein CELE_F56D6.20 [Caenorhabditis elegans]CDH93466.1 Uncharacterized protein CELE_F56D6.20 [Caenorhabditis elegans]|eukprot:NP_001294639.1 Uncharacterized protein CELE_F56D6.20 [Caenorhabditis elegans]
MPETVVTSHSSSVHSHSEESSSSFNWDINEFWWVYLIGLVVFLVVLAIVLGIVFYCLRKKNS